MELYSLNGLEEILKPRNQREDFYDKCNWFVTCLLKRTILDDKRKEKPDNYFANISSKELKKYLGTRDYIDVVEALVDLNIVERNNKYSKEKFSKSYAFTKKVKRMDIVQVEVHSKSFAKRLSDIIEKEYQETIKDPLFKSILENTTKLIVVEEEGYYKNEISELTDEEMDNDVDPEEKLKERWQQYIRYTSFYDSFKLLNETTNPLEVFKSKIYQKPIIAKSGRIYHTVSSIPRYIRKSMRACNNDLIWEVDMTAAQPTLIMLEWLKIAETNFETDLIKRLILNGEIYSYIKEKTAYFKSLEYGKLKKEVLQSLYEEFTKSNRNNALKELFPKFINWVNNTKLKMGYKAVSHNGQKLEAEIFVEVYKKLPEDMFCLIIHDSILCLEQDANTIKELLIKRTKEVFPILISENLDKLFKVSIVSIKDEDLLQVKNERLLREFIEREKLE